MTKNEKRKIPQLEKISFKMTNWVGTPQSIIFHSLFFIGIFFLTFVGFKMEEILLILTTGVSLEAIYLAIFIQMTVNKTTVRLESVEDNLEDIQEDIDQIQEEDVLDEEGTEHSLTSIEKQLQKVIENLDHLKIQVHNHSEIKGQEISKIPPRLH